MAFSAFAFPQRPPARKAATVANPLESLLSDAEQAIEKKEFQAAVESLQKFLAERPEVAYAHFQLGYAFTGLEQWDAARAAYEKALALDPKLDAARLNLALILVEREPAAAVPHLSVLVEQSPAVERLRFLLGFALERSGKLEPATEHYRIAANLNPGAFDPHFALARTLLALGRGAEAEAGFRAALGVRVDSPEARLGLAESLITQKKWEPAAAELAAYLELRPDDHQTRLQRASVLFDLQRYDAALAELDRLDADKLPEKSLRTVDWLRVEIDIKGKRFADAAARLARIADAEPSDAALRARLGRLYLELRDFPAAERELIRALTLDSQLNTALLDLIAVYYLAEKYPLALGALEQLARREELSAGSWFVRATSYDKLGMKAEALEAYQKFLAVDQGRSEDQDFQARQRVRILSRELKRR